MPIPRSRSKLLHTVLAIASGIMALATAVLIANALAGGRSYLPVWLVAIAGSGLMLVWWVSNKRRHAATANAIESITVTAREIARGNPEHSIDVASIDIPELRALADAINDMAGRTHRDIADMKRLERVRSEFLGNISHELRTPIFSVQGYLETLIDGAIDDTDVRDDFLAKAHQNVLRLHTLLTDLIEISRIESGDMRMSFRYFDVAEHLAGIIEELRPTAEMADVTLELVISNNGCSTISALGDRDRIKQVIVNLVENAIKYNRPSGSVHILVEPQPDGILVSVRDTGIGIPVADTDRIFERFYRVDRDRSRSVGGSGLGLAIVKHIIEKHGATILVESTPGVGSTFSFTLKR